MFKNKKMLVNPEQTSKILLVCDKSQKKREFVSRGNLSLVVSQYQLNNVDSEAERTCLLFS